LHTTTIREEDNIRLHCKYQLEETEEKEVNDSKPTTTIIID